MGISKILVIVIILGVVGTGIVGYYFYTKDSFSSLRRANPSFSPVVSSVANKNLDTDKDGLPDVIESAIGTDTTKADTDLDGYDDLLEIKNGYDPKTANNEKLAHEAWQTLKDSINAADGKFYEKNFELVTPSVIASPDSAAVKKCEYPDKIGDYDRRTIENTPLYDEQDSTKLIAQGVLVNYSISNLDMITGIFFNLDNEEKAKSFSDDLLKKSGEICIIGDTTGVCKFSGDFTDKENIDASDMITIEFSWRSGKAIKNAVTGLAALSLMSGEKNEDTTNIKQKTKERLVPFISQFKNCEVEQIN